MMIRNLSWRRAFFSVGCLVLLQTAQADATSRHVGSARWHAVDGNLMTRWAKQVDPAKPLPDYPRPQMVRAQWQNLNGLWNYAITDKDAAAPAIYAGQILVPYPLESALSGVKKPLLPTQNLWYQRSFNRPALKHGEHLLLHFGAVDFEATVFVNGQEVGQHSGGYQNFTFDITDALKGNGSSATPRTGATPRTVELKVKVWDPTDEGPNPHGKQVLKPEGIMYTASSGIWQTVWLETVPATFIQSIILTPDVDNSALKIEVLGDGAEDYSVQATVGESKVSGKPNEPLSLSVPNPRLWSPADPFLYDLNVQLVKQGRVVDTVRSYFGMRKVEVKKDAKDHARTYLNNQYTYNLGVLDQGFWPDGLYTAPTDAALKADIQAIKSMGFNTIRKHIKIEPARWYYYCDTLGVMVWQDMVSPAGKWDDLAPTPDARAQFEAEVKENLAQLHNSPSITTWVLFNEGWGDYDQDRLTQWLKALDPSRLVNGHSGSNILSNKTTVYPAGTSGAASDLLDLHSYPDPGRPESIRGQAAVLGEHGGISVKVKDHMWIDPEVKDWSYEESAAEKLPARYANLVDSLKALEKEGLTASIYTQPFDVEVEQNGLITYDREIMKIPAEEIRRINAKLLDGQGVTAAAPTPETARSPQ